MKIIDSFIFCAAYEKELLLLKLINEAPCVNEWIITECYYDYRGVYKGPIIDKMLHDDKRFLPYMERITTFSVKENLSGNADPNLAVRQVDPPQFGHAEFKLRNYPTQYILDKYKDNDKVIVSDVDELVDFVDTQRRNDMMSILSSDRHEAYQFDRIRYIYDFDNRAYREKWDMVTPIFSIGCLHQGRIKLQDKKWVGQHIELGDRPQIFEYCSCFPREAIYSKTDSSLHTMWSKELVDVALACNHWEMKTYQRIDPNNRWHWFERVVLTDNNSPRYVREHLAELKTGNVPDNYKENRLRQYNFEAKF